MPQIPWRSVERIRGSCLCGGVTYEISGEVSPIGQCHCSLCRKTSGSAAATTLYAKSTGFRFCSGESLIASYSRPSGYTSTFCSRCGSPLPAAAASGGFHYIPAGTLDDEPGDRRVAIHIYVGSKATWEVISDGAPQFAEGMDSPRLNSR
jgi:hypothetical protein